MKFWYGCMFFGIFSCYISIGFCVDLMAMLQEIFSLNCQNRPRVSEPPSRPIGLRPKFSQQENSIWSVFGKFFGSLKTAEISSAKRPWPSAESTTNWRIAQQEEGNIWRWQVSSKLGFLILLCRSGIPATSEKFSTVHDPTISYIAGDWPRKTFHYKLCNILLLEHTTKLLVLNCTKGKRRKIEAKAQVEIKLGITALVQLEQK